MKILKALSLQLIRVFQSVLHHCIVLPIEYWFFVKDIFPIQKYLNIEIIILRDVFNSKIAFPDDLSRSVETVKQLFLSSMTIKAIVNISVAGTPAPAYALTSHCGFSTWLGDFLLPGRYYRSLIKEIMFDFYGISVVEHGYERFLSKIFGKTPIVVFIIEKLEGESIGCSLGSLTDYILLDYAGVHSQYTFAHEIGHACGLLHHGVDDNLMYHSGSSDDNLTLWQKLVIRSSRHISFR